jgi:hypothetical protein
VSASPVFVSLDVHYVAFVASAFPGP